MSSGADGLSKAVTIELLQFLQVSDFERVWPKGWAVAFQATHTGSIPVTRSILSCRL